MPAYRYKAVSAIGKISHGRMMAANEWDLQSYLRDAGLELIDARARREKREHDEKRNDTRSSWRDRITTATAADFTVQLADLLKTGMPFADALRDLAQVQEQDGMRNAAQDIMRKINHGHAISQAFEQHPKAFSPIYTAILAAGSASGDLNRTFGQLAS